MRNLFSTLIGIMIPAFLFAQTLTPVDVELEQLYTGLVFPVGVYSCGDNRLFVLEQMQGDIEMIDKETGAYLGTFLDMTGLISTGSERGLLGMAFHPDYANNGYFYINYTDLIGTTVVARYKVSATNPMLADPTSAHIILSVPQPFSNHNGGHIVFGPDGYLYIGMGDGGGGGDQGNRAQDPQNLLGKMLRINVNSGSTYTIPADNPFVNNPAYLPEIWAVGVRNPWKYSFDRETGDLWIGDVGQNIWEEIDFQPAGQGGINWGWRCYEGNATYNTSGCLDQSNYQFPVVTFNHTSGFISITGGVVYRGQRYPALNGIYFFSDYGLGDIVALYRDASNAYVTEIMFPQPAGTVAFGEDGDGEVYVVNISGQIYRLKDTCGDFYPQLNAASGTLSCSESANQYWWYKDGVLIDGATSQTYSPSTAGNYYCIADNGTCTRQTNTLNWIIVGGVGGCTYANAQNFDPNAQVDDGSCTFGTPAECPGDMDGNGLINVNDLALFLGVFGTICNN